MIKERIYIIIIILALFLPVSAQKSKHVFPGKEWAYAEPGSKGLSSEILDSIAEMLSGRGCIVKDGYIVKTWGDQAEKSDWLSSVKPVFSTFLFFAVEEGLLPDVHYKITNLGWELRPKEIGRASCRERV